MIGENSVVARSESVMSADLDELVVLLNIETGDYYDMNPVGSDMWNMLEQPSTMGDICAQMTESFDIEPDKCRQDVANFLSEMSKIGAVTVS